MIHEVNVGQIVSVLALSYTNPLIDGCYLRVSDKGILRNLCHAATMSANDAYYSAHADGWVFDWEGVASRFMTSYSQAASPGDWKEFQRWIRNGYNGIHTPDLESDIWSDTLHWMLHHREWQEGLQPDIIERATAFARHIRTERRSESFMTAVETIRDHRGNEVDILVKTKSHLNFYNEENDPLIIFINMRGKMILLSSIKNILSQLDIINCLNHTQKIWFEFEGNRRENKNIRSISEETDIAKLEMS